jgi:2-polyprenyl-3-methyl-5-hydroxy-6-metoxy-1,4-benzoquinol methylase
MKPDINDYSDVLHLLDDYVKGIPWDAFYENRNKPAPFIVQNELPDENLVETVCNIKLNTALELGCGEGRNAIYMAKQGVKVTAIDISPVAIDNAKRIANEKGVNVNFLCGDALQFKSDIQYDFIYDSGMFHH